MFCLVKKGEKNYNYHKVLHTGNPNIQPRTNERKAVKT